VHGTYRASMRVGQVPWDGVVSAGDIGFYGKLVLIAGGMQNPKWARPSVALLGGAQFLSTDSAWALDARLAGSIRIGPVLTHLNMGYHHQAQSRVTVGTVVMVPLQMGLAPA